jgi:hypothetical protein
MTLHVKATHLRYAALEYRSTSVALLADFRMVKENIKKGMPMFFNPVCLPVFSCGFIV